jgi:hypothetical protein
VETSSNKKNIFILHTEGAGDNKGKEEIKVRFNFESGNWRINEIDHTLEPHSYNDIIFYN